VLRTADGHTWGSSLPRHRVRSSAVLGAVPPTLRRRKAIVVFVGDDRVGDRGARALEGSLREVGIDSLYLGHQTDAAQIAACAHAAGADTLEICVAGGPAVRLLRELLQELRRLGRPDLSIVVHRVQ
jgi:methylmalonyl-CoA mutase cobalamin-binding domain/chain